MRLTIGTKVRVRMYSGKIIEAVIKAIIDKTGGRKIQVVSGETVALVNPEQIIEVLE